MAGHSKWSNIKHRKGAQDAKRSKIFSKIGREIQVAAKIGGGDPDANPRLRTAIDAARDANMPNERIDKAIKSGTGEGEDAADYEEMRYEGYGVGGVAFIVDTLTDNRNRTAGEVRAAFTKYGGNLGETGSVSFMFEQVGEIVFPAAVGTPEDVFEAAVEAGAMDCESDEDYHTINCDFNDFADVRDALTEKYGKPERSGLVWQPGTMVAVDRDQASTIIKLIDTLEDNDDVQNVYTNFEADDAILEELMSA